MFNSTVLEVAIGLCFAFASISLITSSLNEAVSSLLKLRANTLLAGIKDMLNDRNFEGLARDIYNHALTNPRGHGEAGTEEGLRNKPSYMEARHFALALIDSIQTVERSYVSLGQDIARIGNLQLRRALTSMYERADGSIDTLQTELESWFNYSMERVGGAYKRRMQLTSFLIALALAIVLNVDAVHMFKTLWQHPTLTAQLQAGQQPGLDQLYALPIGWQDAIPAFDYDMLVRVFGWLITASSALFGAPFWFDGLQKLINLRGTAKKSDDEKK